MLQVYLGVVIGLLIGAALMHLRGKKVLDEVNNNLHETQDKLKSVKSQLYKRRTSYKKKTNGSNGKKAVKKATRSKATTIIKKTSI